MFCQNARLIWQRYSSYRVYVRVYVHVRVRLRVRV